MGALQTIDLVILGVFAAAILFLSLPRTRSPFLSIILRALSNVSDSLARAFLRETGVPVPPISTSAKKQQDVEALKGSALLTWEQALDAGLEDCGRRLADAGMRFCMENALSADTFGDALRKNGANFKRATLLAIESAKRLLARVSQQKIEGLSDEEVAASVERAEYLLGVGEWCVACADLMNHAHNLRLMTGYLWPAENWGERARLWPALRTIWGMESCVAHARRWAGARLEEIAGASGRVHADLHAGDESLSDVRAHVRYNIYLSPVRYDVLGVERFWLLRKMSTRVVPLSLASYGLLSTALPLLFPGALLPALYQEAALAFRKTLYGLLTGLGVSISFSWFFLHMGAVDQARFYTAGMRALQELRSEARSHGIARGRLALASAAAGAPPPLHHR